ncbi:MAG: thiamine biosynthesis protein ThiS [Desulfurococcaceae archaeon]|uniref:Thiamine biosynthesis protein ThiS n=1 Tax=Staphylothermus marinus TaxID=2280 RepID=A0A7C4JLU0_STAMA
MVVKVEVRERENIVYEIEANGLTIKELLVKLGLIPSEYVAVKNGNVVTEEDRVVDGDTLILYPVKSGG